MSKKLDEIDRHSKEVHDLLGRVPSWIIRNGIMAVVMLWMVLIAGSWFFQYPDIISAEVVVAAPANGAANNLTTVVRLNQSQAQKIKVGQKVNLKFDSYSYLKYGIVAGRVIGVALVPTHDSFPVEIMIAYPLVTESGQKLDFVQELAGTAEIVTEKVRLLTRILHTGE